MRLRNHLGIALVACLVFQAPAARCDEPPKPVKVRIENYMGDVMEPFISGDGRILLFNDNAERAPKKDIFWAKRLRDNDYLFIGRVEGVNSEEVDGTPVLDGMNNIYFISTRNSKSRETIYTGRFDIMNGEAADIHVVPGIAGEEGWIDMDVDVSPDGNTLYISRADFSNGAPPKSSHLIVATKKDNVFTIDDAIFKNINRDSMVYAAAVSPDGLKIFYTRVMDLNGRNPVFQIMKATRSAKDQPFDIPEVFFTGKGLIEAPAISYNGRNLYFHMKASGDSAIGLYSIPIT